MHLPSAANSSVIILFLILFTITYPNTPPNQKYHVFILTKQGIILSCTLPVNRLSFSALDRFIYRDQESLFCPYPSSVLDLTFHITLSGTMLSHLGLNEYAIYQAWDFHTPLLCLRWHLILPFRAPCFHTWDEWIWDIPSLRLPYPIRPSLGISHIHSSLLW